MAANTLRYCPDCATSVPEGARQCPDCGHALAKSVTGIVPVVVAVMIALALLLVLWAAYSGSPSIDPGI